MKRLIFRYLKHAMLTIIVMATVLIIFGLAIGASASYGDKPARLDWNNEGPYVFYETDSTVSVQYVKGDKDSGFYTRKSDYHMMDAPIVTCYNPLDSTQFEFSLRTEFNTPLTDYQDGQPIFAVSDIEGNYLAFRNFLKNNQIITEDLHWNFGHGHLVLVGDFVDRGFFVTQVLWLIFKLEQEAELAGGKVHYLIGNHELKNLQANFDSASPKYFYVASILGKTQQALYGDHSVLGRWLTSKNAIERINGTLFVHGGLHPDIQQYDITLDEVNEILRKNFRTPYYPKPNPGLEKLLTSTHTGPCWYRGYFKDDLTQDQVDQGIQQFKAKTIVVGHTLHNKAKSFFNGSVIDIDVKHPTDDHDNFPAGSSEGIYIEDGKYYRAFNDGSRKEL